MCAVAEDSLTHTTTFCYFEVPDNYEMEFHTSKSLFFLSFAVITADLIAAVWLTVLLHPDSGTTKQCDVLSTLSQTVFGRRPHRTGGGTCCRMGELPPTAVVMIEASI